MASPLLRDARWIWTDAIAPNTTVGAARQFSLAAAPRSAPLAVFAHLKYKLYVNGRFVNAGPAPFRRPLAMVDSYDLAPFLRKGRNTLFVLAHHVGADLKYGQTGTPGILAALTLPGERVVTDGRWRMYALDCWNRSSPRRNWAIEHVEDLDLAHPAFRVLAALASEDYGDASASKPPANPPATAAKTILRPIEDDWRFEPRGVPPLRWRREDLATVSHVFRTSNDVYNLNDTAVRLSNEHVAPTWDEERYEALRDKPVVRLRRRRGEPGYGVVFDAGRVCAGDAAFEIWSDGPATLELAHAEDFRNGRPNVWRTGGLYYARYHLKPGLNRARFYHFNGFRFLYFVLKDFVGTVEIRRATVQHCRADLDFSDRFDCGDRAAEAVYRISRRSLKLNTQAWTYDCNTREQGTYWGDGVWIADTVGRLTGNFAHLRELCRQTPNEVAATGLPGGSLFSQGQPLYDYCLVPPEAMRRYALYTGDVETMRPLLESADWIVDKFRGRKDAEGWIRLAGWGESEPACRGLLFLDHAGNGWHPMTTTGIDRRDVNAGIHLYYLQALDALVALRRMTDEGGTATSRATAAEAAALRCRLRDTFVVPATGLVRDALPDAKDAPVYSQIVTALAVMTGVLEGEAAKWALRTVLDIERNPWVSQGTPYTYFLLADAAAIAGCAGELLPFFVRAFVPMLERGATTTWEAFGGENHDSLNHAWSAVLPYLIHRGVAGIQPAGLRLSVAPDLSAFATFEHETPLPQGRIRVAWKRRTPESVELELDVPPGLDARLILPGRTVKVKDGRFRGVVGLA
jgi:hypothetical protein